MIRSNGTSLTSISIGSGLQTYGKQALYSPSLEKIEINETNAGFNITDEIL